MPGKYCGKDVTIQDVFEAVGAFRAGKMSAKELDDIEGCASPGAGACGGPNMPDPSLHAITVPSRNSARLCSSPAATAATS